MVVVTGRRRVGKTTLILKALENRNASFVYCFVPRIASERDLAGLIAASLTGVSRILCPGSFFKGSQVDCFVVKDSVCHDCVGGVR